VVDYPGWWRIPIGWIYNDKDVLVFLNVTTIGGEVYGVYIDGYEYNNPLTVLLKPGNHTVSVVVYVPDKIQIKVEYRVLT